MLAALCLPEATVPTAKPERAYCTSCGFPLRGSRCEICGGDQTPIQLAEGEVRDPRASLDDGATQGLERAIEAHRNRELARFVGYVVTAEGGAGARSVSLPEGPGWIAAIRGSLVFVSIHGASTELVLQAPVARISRAQRVPILRLALELCAQELPAARFCLREDLLLLRFGAKLAAMTPLVLRDLLREIGHLAARWAELFAVSFDANPALEEHERASAGFEILGRTRKLRLAAGMMRSTPPPGPTPSEIAAAARAEATRTVPQRPASPRGVEADTGPQRPVSRAPDREDIEAQQRAIARSVGREDLDTGPQRAVARSMGREDHDTGPQRVVARSVGREEFDTGPQRPVARSAGHAESERPSQRHQHPSSGPSFSAKAPLQPPPPSRPAPDLGTPMAELPEPIFELAASSVRPPRPAPSSEPIPDILAPMFAAGPSRGGAPVIPPLPPLPSGMSSPRMRAVSMPELDLEAPSRQPSVPGAALSQETREPADRLCGLLRQAKALASLVLEARPATMPWLVRATVFRSIHEHRDALPDAVAHLYRCMGMGRDAPEPALLVLDRVLGAHAHHPGEKPLAVDPLSSAAQAKEHISRYVLEIERAPLDPVLRHFLAMGALSELLARAKLPAQTEVRLRDIVGHAQREGAKQGTIDLMMTALQRITGG